MVDDRLIFEVLHQLVTNNFLTKPKIPAERVILLGWLIYCFLVTLFFQSKLTSFFSRKTYLQDIDTIEQLYRSGTDVFAFRNQIIEIQKKYTGTPYSGVLAQLKQLPDDVASLEISRDSVYHLVFLDDANDYLRPFIVNRDRAMYLSRVRKYRINGK